MQLAPALRTLIRMMVRLSLFALVLGGPAMVIYLGTVGFPKRVLDAVCSRISSPMYTIRVERLTYHPWNGLVGHELSVRGSDGKQLLLVNRVDLFLNIKELVQRRIAFDTIKLSGATLAVPIRPDFELHLKDVRAQLSLKSEELKISQFDFRWEKIWFSVTGRLSNPGQLNLSLAETRSENDGFIRILRKVALVMAEIHYGQKTPSVACVIEGDLADVQSIKVQKLVAKTPRLRWRKLALSDVSLEARYLGGVFDCRLRARDARGDFAFKGTYSTLLREGSFEATSALNPMPVIQSIHAMPELKNFVFSKGPTVDVDGQISENNGKVNSRLVGHVEGGDFEFRNVKVSRFASDFIYENGQFLTRGAKLLGSGLDLTIDTRFKEGIWNVRLDGEINPSKCLPWFDEGLRTTLKEVEFVDPVELSIEGQMGEKSSSGIRGNGVLKAGRTGLRGSWIDAGQTNLRFEEGLVAYDNVNIKQGTQTASADLVYDFKRREMRFSNIHSEWMPWDILVWADVNVAEAVRPYRFNRPPFASGSGVIDLDGHQERNRINVQLDAPTGLQYDLLGKTLNIEAAKASLDIKNNLLVVDVNEARMYGGQVRLLADVSLDPKNAVYSANVIARHLNFPQLTKLYFDYDISKGWMDADVSFQAPILHSEDLVGRGSIHIQNGTVFAIPILGPLSVILNEIIPGAGYQSAREATAFFTIRNQTIQTQQFEIEGKGFSVLGAGDIYFMKDRMNMTARINAQGLPGVVFFPVSKLFEYVSDGSISNPIWRPKRIPTGLFKLPMKESRDLRKAERESAAKKGEGEETKRRQ